MLLTGAITNILLRWKLRHLPGHFGIQVSLSQQAKKKSTVLGEAIYQEEIGCFSKIEVRKIMDVGQELLYGYTCYHIVQQLKMMGDYRQTTKGTDTPVVWDHDLYSVNYIINKS